MTFAINDGKSTPVAHSFTQDAQQNGADPAEFVNRSNVNGPSFWERFKSWVTLGTSNKPHVIKVKLTRPIAGMKDGNPAVLGSHQAIVTLLIDPSVSAAADVKDTVTLIQNYLANTTLAGQMSSFAPAVA